MISYYQSCIKSCLAEIESLKEISTLQIVKDGVVLPVVDKFSENITFKKYRHLFSFSMETGLLDVSEAIKKVEKNIENHKNDLKNFPELLTMFTRFLYGDHENWVNYYLVKAPTAEEAVEMLHCNSFQVFGRTIESSYDCTGQPFSNGVSMRDVFWSSSHKCYVVPVYWGLDV